MTKTYAIRPLSYSNFTNREFESLMMDTHQSLATFSKANKDEGMYVKHLEPFKTKPFTLVVYTYGLTYIIDFFWQML